ncbi:MAG: hypothetical protein ABIC57_03205 [bacterium]
MADLKDTHNSQDNQKQVFLDSVARYCDKCGKPYDINDVEILQQNNYSVIIHFSCKNCKARHLATFIKPLGVSSRMPVNTDLSIKEIAEFASKKAVSTNDVLDVHDLMRDTVVKVKDLI